MGFGRRAPGVKRERAGDLRDRRPVNVNDPNVERPERSERL